MFYLCPNQETGYSLLLYIPLILLQPIRACSRVLTTNFNLTPLDLKSDGSDTSLPDSMIEIDLRF